MLQKSSHTVTSRETWLALVAQMPQAEDGQLFRRKQPRHAVQGFFQLRYGAVGADGSHPRTLFGRLLDVSPDGCMLRVDREIEFMTPVILEVTLDDHLFVLNGRVMHSTGTVGAYKLGIRLTFE